MKIGILNGPNLDRLGKREPEIYGAHTLDDLAAILTEDATGMPGSPHELAFFQSNHEGELIDQLALWSDEQVGGVVFNPGALTHTSLALRDAIAGSGLRVVEVHITNIYRREEFRRHSLTAPACAGVISGLGFEGYRYALRFLCKKD